MHFNPKCISHHIRLDVPPLPLRRRASSTSIISPPYSESHVPFLMSFTANTPNPPCRTEEARTSKGGSCSFLRFRLTLRCVLMQSSDAGKSERTHGAHTVSNRIVASVDNQFKCCIRFLFVEIYLNVMKHVFHQNVCCTYSICAVNIHSM